jgi:hypothetical protein
VLDCAGLGFAKTLRQWPQGAVVRLPGLQMTVISPLISAKQEFPGSFA